MPNKSYQVAEDAPLIVSEPAVAYQRTAPFQPSIQEMEYKSSDRWSPNVPFHGTQEEWWEHFHRIEEGEFMTVEEFDIKFNAWKKKLLASKLK